MAMQEALRNDVRVGPLNVGSASTAFVKLLSSSLRLNFEKTMLSSTPVTSSNTTTPLVTAGLIQFCHFSFTSADFGLGLNFLAMASGEASEKGSESSSLTEIVSEKAPAAHVDARLRASRVDVAIVRAAHVTSEVVTGLLEFPAAKLAVRS
jgi:hypothetical protein